VLHWGFAAKVVEGFTPKRLTVITTATNKELVPNLRRHAFRLPID
jgi:hypothetical protein